MSELLPCAHHEEEIYPEREVIFGKYAFGFGEGYAVEYMCNACGWHTSAVADTEEEADEMAADLWNIRHERTCRPIFKKLGIRVVSLCSECGSKIEPGKNSAKYCPYCGAKVVVG